MATKKVAPKKAAAKPAAAKKPAAKKAVAAKKPAVAKKPAAKKAVAAKKPAAKKAVAAKKPAAKKVVAKKPVAAKKPVKKVTKRKPNAEFMKPVKPSEALAEIVGSKKLPRTEITKKIWDYIKKNKLQNADDKRLINVDAKLRPLFGNKSTVTMFELPKMIKLHVDVE